MILSLNYRPKSFWSRNQNVTKTHWLACDATIGLSLSSLLAYRVESYSISYSRGWCGGAIYFILALQLAYSTIVLYQYGGERGRECKYLSLSLSSP